MSELKLQGGSSGSSTYIIQGGAGDTNRTFTLPNVADATLISTNSSISTLPKAPLAIAYKDSAAQAIPTATWTKVTFDAEEVDTDNWFASSTYTPQQAGYYFVTCCLYYQFLQLDVALMSLYKNGSEYSRLQRECVHNELSDTEVSGSCLVHCNGSTDYLEIYAYQDSGSNKNIYNGGSNSGRPFTSLEIFLVRAD